jgi:protein arginine kinase
MVLKIIEWERGIRSLLVEQDRMKIKDQVWESLGALRSAQKITSQETMKHLSALRLGVNLDLLSDLTLQTVNELFLFTQPAHIKLLTGANLDPDERDRWRARFLRGRLGAEES